MGVENAGFLKDTLDTTATAATKAWSEDLTPAGDSAGVQDLAFLADDLVVEVAGDGISLPGQSISLTGSTAASGLFFFTKRVINILRDEIKLRSHVVFERFVGQKVLENEEEDVKADYDTS